MLLGIMTALILHIAFGEDTIRFNQHGFFYGILPPIIFAAGYTLKRKSFVKNIGEIMALGIGGTIISFIVISLVITIANKYLFGEVITDKESLLLAAVMSATDTISVLTLDI